MKVLVTHIDFNAYFPIRLKHFQNYLEQRGHELYIIETLGKAVLYSFSNVKKDGLNIECLLPNESYNSVSPGLIDKQLTTRLNHINPDVIIAGPIAFPPSATSVRWAKKNKKSVVIFDNAHKDTFPRGRITTWIKRSIYRNVDAFLCPSPSYDETMRYWGFTDKQIFYGLNVTDNEFWSEKVSGDSFNYLPNQYFLTVGRQVPFKNLNNLIDAYSKYRDRGGKTSLVMVGEGPSHDELLEKSKLTESIIFLPFQTYEKIREVFVNAQSLFLPSLKTETWGLIVNESMAAGVIVAVSNECGCHDTLIKDNGYLFNPYDCDEIASIMIKIDKLSNVEKTNMRKIGYNIISQWDLNRFSEGAYKAILYSVSHKKKRTILDSLIVNLWKGQLNKQQGC